MQIITYLTTGLILALANFFLYNNNKKIQYLIKNLFCYIIGFNIISLSIYKYIFRKTNILNPAIYNWSTSLIYVLGTLLLGLIYLFVKKLLKSKITFTNIENKNIRKSIIINCILIICFFIGVTFIFFSKWFIDYFGEITPEQFLFNLKSPLDGTSPDMVMEIISTPLFAIISTTTLFIYFINFKYELLIKVKDLCTKIYTNKIHKIVSLLISLIVLIGGVTYGFNKLSLSNLLNACFANSHYFDDNYIDPRKVKMSFPAQKRNLIHIYLESIESSYLSKDLGGYMDENLMPELTELAKEGIHFSDNDVFGGANQTYGSSWSVAGMVNMSTGIPLKVNADRNKYGLDGSFLPGAVTIGDILDAEGYNQTIMFGANANYGGLTEFFTSHGHYNIFDLKAARKKGLIPNDYKVWWGFEDDKLYEYAKDELTRLYAEGKPFNFSMETADTHFPDGYLSPNVENKYPQQYANVIAYSTKETVEFINWIKQQPFYENTTIVLTGDHLSMDKKFFKDFDPEYRRSTFNLILNAPITTENTKYREFAPYDMFPTILASMGIEIEGNRLGMGTNLFSSEKTLIERDGLEKVNTMFEKNSNFFTNEFISDDKNSIFTTDLVTEREN